MDSGAKRSLVDHKWLYSPKKEHATCQLKQLEQPLRVMGAGSTLLAVTQTCEGELEVKKHQSKVELLVLKDLLQGVDVILGMDWLIAHKAQLNCGSGTVALRDSKRRWFKLRTLAEKGPKEGRGEDQYLCCVDVCTVAAMREAHEKLGSEALSARQAAKLMRKGARSWLALVQEDGSVRVKPPGGTFMCSPKSTRVGSVPAAVAGLAPESDIDKLVRQEFKSVFEETWSASEERPVVPHTIRTEEGHPPPFRRGRRLTPGEETEMKRQVADLLARGMITPSCSPYGAPVVFVQKKDGSLRMCVDYRALNKITIKDRYPLPRIDDLLAGLRGKTVFSSLDLQSGYHQLRITDEDAPKTAFIAPGLGQFEFKVLCFGLTNAPATFMRAMHQIFADLIGKTVLVYLDDILVMSRTPEEHVRDLREVLSRLQKHKLYAKLSKCEFNKAELKFLGHVVGRNGISVDPEKVAVIQKWPVPKNVKELQAFLGLANYFRKFIEKYSTVAAPLTALTSKDAAAAFDWVKWGAKELAAFNKLKQELMSAPVLALPDPELPFEVHSDASDVGTGGILMQEGRVVEYTSSKFNEHEVNYNVTEKELLGLIRALQAWRCYLEGAKHDVVLLTDHQPLVTLKTQPSLSRRQVRWMEFLSRFHFEFRYKPGPTNIADPISRNPTLYEGGPLPVGALVVLNAAFCLVVTRGMTREQAEQGQPPPYPPGARPGGGEGGVRGKGSVAGPRRGNLNMEALGQKASDTSPARQETGGEAPGEGAALVEEIRAAYGDDVMFTDPTVTKAFTASGGLWWTRVGKDPKVVVPNSPSLRRRLVEEYHVPAYRGHPGRDKTLELLARYYWWSTMSRDVDEFVAQCDSCQRNKASTRRIAGKIQPLPVPRRRFGCWSMDLIVKLPRTERGYDSILVFVDRLTKLVHLVPCRESMDAKECAQLFVDTVVRMHGWPDDVLSDRGGHFHNQFWQHVCELWGVGKRMSSAYHPQTDGQTERVNRVVEEALRHYIKPDQTDWDRWLGPVEFGMNNSWHSSIKHTPFYLCYGEHPLMPGEVRAARKRAWKSVPAAERFATQVRQAVKEAQKSMEWGRQRVIEREANKRREVMYTPGDEVLLNTLNLRGREPGANKLKPRYVGPFRVVEMVGPVAVRLDLPREWARVHSVFHVSLVKPYKTDGAGRREVGPPPMQWLDGEPLYEVERLLDHRDVKKGRKMVREYLVRWSGYSEEHDTWEPRSNLLTCGQLVREYKLRVGLAASESDEEEP